MKERFYLRPMAGWFDVVDRTTGRVIKSVVERREAKDVAREAHQLARSGQRPLKPNAR